MGKRSLLIALVAFGSAIAVTHAAQAGVRCGTVAGLSYGGDMKFCMRSDIYVAAVGRITPDTHKAFHTFLNEVMGAGLRPESVTFHSPGGNMFGGMVLGKFIRELRLDTHVGEGSTCASACMLAFIGGWSRKVTHDGRIGNHQFANDTNVGSVSGVQNLIGLLSEYHEVMNVSPLAVTAAMRQGSADMHWYTPQERTKWGIVTKR